MTKPLETQLTFVTRSASSPGRQSFGPFNMTDTHCRPDSCQKSWLSHIFKIDFMTWKWFSSSFISRHPVETLAELATHYLLFTGFLIPRHGRSCHLLIHSWFWLFIHITTVVANKNGRNCFGHNYPKSSPNSKRKVSFVICLFSAFQNWPYFWHLAN